MATIRGCDFPDDYFYSVEHNVWARLEADGTVTLGATSFGLALAGEIVSCMPKRPGREIELNRAVATLESGKWVDSMKSPISGEIVAINEEVEANPALINQDPYGAGWIVRMKPANWPTESTLLVTGPAIAQAFKIRMDAEGFGI
ncbi:glycine cleavage system H protein 2 [Sulfurimicrobium lacus]|uniref:Glycine cleavage system H protein 2 n=1 Tax=Sulfurimicrobium lacus TaxID=2715678 RepID=A0A6F8V834_9PROT|nr:glycine cleavage system protein H [Sulfurimicrobium lacus]BCB25824.1 glycine cleavage system H protein 2 [Sulfurimicrobium lacus]